VPVLYLIFQSLQEWLRKQNLSDASDAQLSTSHDEPCSTTSSSVCNRKCINDAATLHAVDSTNKTSSSCKKKPVSSAPNASHCSGLPQSSQTRDKVLNTRLPSVGPVGKNAKTDCQVAPLADRQQGLPGKSKLETAHCKGSVLETGDSGRAGRDCQETTCASKRKPQVSPYLETSSKSLLPSGKTYAPVAGPPTGMQSQFTACQNVTRKQLNASVVQSTYNRKSCSLPSSSAVSKSSAVVPPSVPPKQKETSSVKVVCAVSISASIASRSVGRQAQNVKAVAKKGDDRGSHSSETSEVCMTDSQMYFRPL
jgi:hypothetical protein